MAEDKRNSTLIVQNVSGIKVDAPQIQNEAKRKISILDTAKIPYQRATVNLDKNLHEQITSVNDTLYAVVEEYDKRIDVQGCRTDLFWRLTGITSTQSGAGRGPDTYHFTCTQLGTTYPKSKSLVINSATCSCSTAYGLSTNTVTYYNGSTYTQFCVRT